MTYTAASQSEGAINLMALLLGRYCVVHILIQRTIRLSSFWKTLSVSYRWRTQFFDFGCCLDLSSVRNTSSLKQQIQSKSKKKEHVEQCGLEVMLGGFFLMCKILM